MLETALALPTRTLELLAAPGALHLREQEEHLVQLQSLRHPLLKS